MSDFLSQLDVRVSSYYNWLLLTKVAMIWSIIVN